MTTTFDYLVELVQEKGIAMIIEDYTRQLESIDRVAKIEVALKAKVEMMNDQVVYEFNREINSLEVSYPDIDRRLIIVSDGEVDYIHDVDELEVLSFEEAVEQFIDIDMSDVRYILNEDVEAIMEDIQLAYDEDKAMEDESDIEEEEEEPVVKEEVVEEPFNSSDWWKRWQ